MKYEPTPDISAIKKNFPGACDRVYCDVGGRALLSKSARKSLDEHLDVVMSGKVDKASYFEMVERVRVLFARIVNADSPAEIAITKNTSDGINMIASAIHWKSSDNVVICGDLEHPNNIYPWLNQANRTGLEVRSVASKNGNYDVAAIIRALDENTKLVTACSVTFSPGLRTDLKAIGDACRERGILFLVDGAQSIGILDLDVQELNIDAVAVATQKGLLGLYGLGFLYCRREVAEKLTPTSLARFGVDLGSDTHEAGSGSLDYKLMAAAQRFDLGNYNFPAAAVAEDSMNLLLGVGVKNIEQHVLGLNKSLAEGFFELGIDTTPVGCETNRSHTLTAGTFHPNINDRGGDEKTQDLALHLRANNIVFSLRKGMLRFTFHIYNDEQDIGHIIKCASDWRKQYKL